MTKRILVRCPSTAKLTPTGQTVEEEAWAEIEVETAQVHLPALQQRARLDEKRRRPRPLICPARLRVHYSLGDTSDVAPHRDDAIFVVDDFETEAFVETHRRIVRLHPQSHRGLSRVRPHPLREQAAPMP